MTSALSPEVETGLPPLPPPLRASCRAKRGPLATRIFLPSADRAYPLIPAEKSEASRSAIENTIRAGGADGPRP